MPGARSILRFLSLSMVAFAAPSPAQAQTRNPGVVKADVVALDHLIVYNRFGSFNPFGMIYALEHDVRPRSAPVVASKAERPDPRKPLSKADNIGCNDLTGAEGFFESSGSSNLRPGEVRLRDCKRPRPLAIRANVGDILEVKFMNLLRSEGGTGKKPDISQTFCPVKRNEATRKVETSYNFAPGGAANHEDEIRGHTSDGGATWMQESETKDLCDPNNSNAPAGSPKNSAPALTVEGADWPSTRGANFVINGLRLTDDIIGDARDQCLGLRAVMPGNSVTCRWHVDREGPHFISSTGAVSGGEGDGGSLTHGLFGALIAEPEGSVWYRSQVTRAAFDAAWSPDLRKVVKHARSGALDYEKKTNGVPILNMLKDEGSANSLQTFRLVHSDLNAIVKEPLRDRNGVKIPGGKMDSFREFSVILHDELKTFYTDAYKVLERYGEGQLAGVRDGFGINYGSSGMGTMLIANRKGIGPAADCVECLYEEFFLQSWANGDPALLESYADDPSNVHHSYLNDRVVFRNFHAGPKETHVFHLHAHQWFAGNDNNRGAYLDSQTVGPQQAFSYKIYHGGNRRFDPGYDYNKPQSASGWWETMGTGNRNRTPGDSIFHCHLYPHFAQGMWELWRSHDVLEDGSRKLPDGQLSDGLSLVPRTDPKVAGRFGVRRGTSVETGPSETPSTAEGTPVPAIIPLPDQPAPLLPTYGDSVGKKGMPGYPFYVAGEAGRRAPQPPLDMAVEVKDGKTEVLDGGLPRHVVLSGEREFKADPESKAADVDTLLARSLALGDFSADISKANLKLLPLEGTSVEKRAMAFHYNGKGLDLRTADGKETRYDAKSGGYLSGAPNGGALTAKVFAVNGAPPKPGAPFADPCGAPSGFSGTRVPLTLDTGRPNAKDGTWAWSHRSRRMRSATDQFVVGNPDVETKFTPDPALSGFRRYEVSAVQLNLVVNKAGWHDPQARINVLSSLADDFKGTVRGDAEPFFFRAHSGECIEFRHTNELPKELARDDFQVATPTDTIGQHIHLVKFDVTSADGSGNGFNYEDGTFAPDEIFHRICAAREAGMPVNGTRPGEIRLAGRNCKEIELIKKGEKIKSKYEESRRDYRGWFQTTVQRWFADPILSETGNPDKADPSKPELLDRTMRTVFTHDHFGPSSIQQHGFYAALVIEPAGRLICLDGATNGASGCAEKRRDVAQLISHGGLTDQKSIEADKIVTGARRVVVESLEQERARLAKNPSLGLPKDSDNPNVREYMMAIADFATLYDPVAKRGAEQFEEPSPKGLVCLAREALTVTGVRSGDIENVCRGADEPVIANEAAEDLLKRKQAVPAHMAKLSKKEAEALKDAAVAQRERQGSPIAAPRRPESISVDHHDPYLVNYRNEPIPLRVGSESNHGSPLALMGCRELANLTAVPREWRDRSVKFQAGGVFGDMSKVFRSALDVRDPHRIGESRGDPSFTMLHGDPCTPMVEAYGGEKIQVRLIQGAQEVQHMFTLEGLPHERNIDQKMPAAAPRQGVIKEVHDRPTIWQWCQEKARTASWMRHGDPVETDAKAGVHDRLRSLCDNIDGFVATQEIGISEHFEFSAPLATEGTVIAGTGQGVSRRKAEFQPATRVFEAPPEIARSGDSLYHFGTLDALWNGAWGLVRTFPNNEQPVPTKTRNGVFDWTLCLEDAFSALARQRGEICVDEKHDTQTTPYIVEKRFRPLRELVKAVRPDSTGVPPLIVGPPIMHPVRLSKAAEDKLIADRNRAIADRRAVSPQAGGAPPPLEAQRAKPPILVISCPADAPRVEANIAAVQAKQIFPEGMIYRAEGADRLVDPDGLLFLPFGKDPKNKVRRIPDIDAANDLKPMLQRPDSAKDFAPLVIRINAGDCLTLRYSNQLPQRPTVGLAAVPNTLDDGRGDAEMPKITPLNVEPDHYWDQLTGKYISARGASKDQDIKPSSSLAITLGLSMTGNIRETPAPFGLNRTGALPPNASAEVTYYAGIFDGDWQEFDQAVRGKGKTARWCSQLPRARLELATSPVQTGGRVIIYGRAYVVSGLELALKPDVDAENKRKLQACVHDALNIYRSAKPYAFGPIALRSFGDHISHTPHGLWGAVVVEPRCSTYPGRPENMAADKDVCVDRKVVDRKVQVADKTKVELLDVAQMKPSAKITLQKDFAKLIDGNDKALPKLAGGFTEHVLFWQDGLNLHHAKDGKVGTEPVADCHICDDSYDFGKKGVSYRSTPMFFRYHMTGKIVRKEVTLDDGRKEIMDVPVYGPDIAAFPYAGNADMNRHRMDDHIFPAAQAPHVLKAAPGDEVVYRIVHPGGRARQRAFIVSGAGYEDLFPSFGFPNSALLGPGKAISAALARPVANGCTFFRDGPALMVGHGVWGLMDVGNTCK